jgi:hypothetical protein
MGPATKPISRLLLIWCRHLLPTLKIFDINYTVEQSAVMPGSTSFVCYNVF